MMKKIYFLLLVLFGLNLQGQIVNIPDAHFKARLLGASSSNYSASTNTPVYNAIGGGNWEVSNYHAVDTNGDGSVHLRG